MSDDPQDLPKIGRVLADRLRAADAGQRWHAERRAKLRAEAHA